jgi:hypothetical protein
MSCLPCLRALLPATKLGEEPTNGEARGHCGPMPLASAPERPVDIAIHGQNGKRRVSAGSAVVALDPSQVTTTGLLTLRPHYAHRLTTLPRTDSLEQFFASQAQAANHPHALEGDSSMSAPDCRPESLRDVGAHTSVHADSCTQRWEPGNCNASPMLAVLHSAKGLRTS